MHGFGNELHIWLQFLNLCACGKWLMGNILMSVFYQLSSEYWLMIKRTQVINRCRSWWRWGAPTSSEPEMLQEMLKEVVQLLKRCITDGAGIFLLVWKVHKQSYWTFEWHDLRIIVITQSKQLISQVSEGYLRHQQWEIFLWSVTHFNILWDKWDFTGIKMHMFTISTCGWHGIILYLCWNAPIIMFLQIPSFLHVLFKPWILI